MRVERPSRQLKEVLLSMRIVVLPGDGIGPEIAAAAVRGLREVDRLCQLGLTIEEYAIGLASLAAEGTTAPARAMIACQEAQGIVLGPISHLDYAVDDPGSINVSAKLRLDLDLYANIRPSRTRAVLPHYGRTPMDLVVVRENTEGFYADRNMYMGSGEFMPTPDVALAVRKITARGARRVAESAFLLARSRRQHVTAVHKANVLKVSDGLFLRAVREVASRYPDVRYEERLVDAMAALLVRDAESFDVVLASNMFGDILSDEAAELCGSLGLAGSINVGEDHCMAQAQHGSAPSLAGQDRANPCSLILSAGMLLSWLAGRAGGRENYARAAALIDSAVEALLADPARRTADLGGPLGTQAFAQALCAELSRQAGAAR
jgi:3-isopropylmalate dehydrogenase